MFLYEDFPAAIECFRKVPCRQPTPSCGTSSLSTADARPTPFFLLEAPTFLSAPVPPLMQPCLYNDCAAMDMSISHACTMTVPRWTCPSPGNQTRPDAAGHTGPAGLRHIRVRSPGRRAVGGRSEAGAPAGVDRGSRELRLGMPAAGERLSGCCDRHHPAPSPNSELLQAPAAQSFSALAQPGDEDLAAAYSTAVTKREGVLEYRQAAGEAAFAAR